jgi:DNA helicase-2/ATP-dependent DNA helicase PcrA
MPVEPFIPDRYQQEVINISGGFHLVLAPPGCGKTQILAERLRKAHDLGVAYKDMLCLTFTNRAARGMKERINQNIDDDAADDVYVGNVHRFCSKFLFDNSLVPAESAIIDDDDAISIIAGYLSQDESQVYANFAMRRRYSTIIHISSLMYQIRHGHAKNIRVHPECISKDDVMAMDALSKLQHKPFDAAFMIDVYDHVDFYRTVVLSPDCTFATQQMVNPLLEKMHIAHAYQDYKERNKLLDFEDILLFAYDALAADIDCKFKRYPWIQVDEVQDLNALQLAIVDLIMTKQSQSEKLSLPVTVMYLGDEQQAIFSFMGAKMATIDLLKKRCEGNIHHLFQNHRSPKYLLDVFNTYANKVLNIDSSLLPAASSNIDYEGNNLQTICSEEIDSEYIDVANVVKQLFDNNKNDTVAVIVSSNSDADTIGDALKNAVVPHFKVSGTDLFSTEEVKTLFSHLAVLNNGLDFIAWARLLKGLHVFNSNDIARVFVRSLFDRAMLPSDFLLYDGSTYVQDFAHEYEEHEMVIFDTETTGLDVLNDDIIQIAAVKMRGGKVVDGSHFNVFVSTNRPIPQKLGDVDNPIIDEMNRNKLHEHSEALQMFIDYVGDDVILGHNVEYDYNILDYNLRRYLPAVNLRISHSKYFDSLLLARLLEPNLANYKLKYLLETLNLVGNNAHLADEDVNATCSLVAHCYQKALEIIGSQREFLKRPRLGFYVDTFRRNYSKYYLTARKRLYEKDTNPESALVGELRTFYNGLIKDEMISEVDKVKYLMLYLANDIVKKEDESVLAIQISNHIIEMSTLKEADLCGSDVLDERVFVTTVHKAKGLEFDDVIVFDAVEGRYPNFYNQDNLRLKAEDARKFYVALSRAKKRLFITWSKARRDYHGMLRPHNISPFMKFILKFFNDVG